MNTKSYVAVAEQIGYRSDTAQTPLLELDLLKTLVAIADTGNFSAAAEAVFRTPSAVSMQVKRIEETLGRPIFTRDSRSVEVTADGEVLIEHGRRLLALNRKMVAHFIKPEVTGRVALGAPDDVAEFYLPAMLRRFSESHCCITVDVVVDSSINLSKRVRKGELDLTLTTIDPSHEHSSGIEILHREPLVWAGLKNGIAYEQDPLPVSVWEEGCFWRHKGLESLDEIGRDYRIAYMSAHISGQRAAIQADLAVAPIPISSCVNGVIPLGEKHGLPELQDYALGLMLAANPSAPALAAADLLRASYM